jgi:hypothetical protein
MIKYKIDMAIYVSDSALVEKIMDQYNYSCHEAIAMILLRDKVVLLPYLSGKKGKIFPFLVEAEESPTP